MLEGIRRAKDAFGKDGSECEQGDNGCGTACIKRAEWSAQAQLCTVRWSQKIACISLNGWYGSVCAALPLNKRMEKMDCANVATAQGKYRSLRILIVEDHEDTASTLAMVLRLNE